MAELDRILELAQAERAARNSPNWKSDPEAACERHGEACDTLYAELYRLLDERASIGNPVKRALPPAVNLRRDIKRELISHLRERLPGLIKEALDDG